MSSSTIIRPATSADQAAVKALIFSILDEYGLEVSPKTTDKDLDDLEGFYQGGLFDVLEREGEIIGTVGLQNLGGGKCELRKMYLAAKYRGRGQGARLLKHAIMRAKEIGFTRMELQTARVLEEAIGLYTKHGFVPFDDPNIPSRCDQALCLNLTA